jgi:hypothetical protein
MEPNPTLRAALPISWKSWSLSLSGNRLWAIGLIAVLIAGIVLRLVWVTDMEYKGDEIWTFEHVQDVRQGGPLPMLGMPTSQYFLNPGMSLWVFLPLAEIAQVKDPVDLCRAVQVVNILALLCLVGFGLWIVPAADREYWLWAAALVSVNPLAVLFQRKIWPPCIFPIIIMAFLLSWWRRDKRAGAFCWGLIGACLGQIQGAGFFFAFGFVMWTLLFEGRKAAWGSWFVGSCIGSLSMLPWLNYLAHTTAADFKPKKPGGWMHLVEGKFWSRWIMEPLGFGLDYSLNRDYVDFLRYPLIGGHATYLVLILHVLIGLLGAAIFVFALLRLRRGVSRSTIVDRFIGRGSPTAFTQNAAFWGYGIVVTLSMLPLHRPYMIILFPLQFLWLARIALGTTGQSHDLLRGRALLTALVVCQALISAQFLSYIHVRPAIDGDYGVPYRETIRSQRQASCPLIPASSECTC